MTRLLVLALVLACGCKKAPRRVAPSDGGSALAVGDGATRDGGTPSDAGVRDARAAAIPVDAAVGAAGLAVFDGRPGWVVIGDSMDSHARALARAAALRAKGIPATVVLTDLLANLTPGWYVVLLGRFDDKAAALAHRQRFAAELPKAYVKESGAIVGSVGDGGASVLPRLVRIFGTATHEEDPSPKLEIVTPDDDFETRPDDDGRFELWVATTGTVTIAMRARETRFPEPCSRRGANEFWMGGHEEFQITGADPAEHELEVERHVEGNPCD